MQASSTNLSTLWNSLQLHKDELFMMSVGSSCHEENTDLCLRQMISENGINFILGKLLDPSLWKTLIIIDSSFTSRNQLLLQQHLNILLDEEPISVVANTQLGIETFTLLYAESHMRVVCYKTNLPINFIQGDSSKETSEVEREKNEGLSIADIQLFYGNFQKFTTDVVANGGFFILLNFVRFRNPNAMEKHIQDWLQSQLYYLFPPQPLYQSLQKETTTDPPRRLLLNWVGYRPSRSDLNQCLYEPSSPLDKGIVASIDPESLKPKVFVPYLSYIDILTMIETLPEPYKYTQNLFRRGKFTVGDILITDSPDGKYHLQFLSAPT